MKATYDPDYGIRRAIALLAAAAVLLVTAGVLIGWMWVTGIGVWALIAAVLTEMLYRP
ncbi:hypothetical protein ACWGJ2_35870 [Streptomyces sp. NPDC054796]